MNSIGVQNGLGTKLRRSYIIALIQMPTNDKMPKIFNCRYGTNDGQ